MGNRGLRTAWVGCVLLGGLFGGHALAEPPPGTAAALAAQVLEAHESGDELRVRELAALDDPDPWRVADALLGQGAFEAALLFATAAPRQETRALPRYVETWRPREDEAARRAALAQAASVVNPGQRAKRLADVLRGPDDVLEVRRHHARGHALRSAHKLLESAAAFERAAEVADRIGWAGAQAEALYEAGTSLYNLGAFDDALTALRRRLTVETDLGNLVGMGRGCYGVAITMIQLTRDDAARRHMKKARAYAKEAHDHEYLAKILGSDARALAYAGEFVRALEMYQEATRLLERVGAVPTSARFVASPLRIARIRVQFLLNAASMAGQAERWSEFEALSREAVELATESKDARLLLETRGQTAGAAGARHEVRGEAVAALDAFTEARDAYARLRDRVNEADYMRRIAAALIDLGDYVAALEMLESAAQVHEELGTRRLLSRVHCEMGRTLTQLGEYERAHDHYLTARDLAVELGLPLVEFEVILLQTGHHIARGDYAAALRLLRDAEEFELPEGVATHEASRAIQLGHIQNNLGDHDRAVTLYQRAAEVYKAAGNAKGLVLAQSSLATTWINQGRLDEAGDLMRRILAGQRSRNDRVGQASTLYLLGSIENELRHNDMALELLSESIGLWDEMAVPDRAAKARHRLAGILLVMGRVGEAHEVLSRVREVAERVQEPYLLAQCYGATAAAYLQSGEIAKSVTWARRSVDQLRFVGRDLSGDIGARARSAYAEVHETGARAAAQAADTAQLYHFLENGRAMSLIGSLGGRERLRETALPAEARAKETEARTAEARALVQLRRARRDGALVKVRDANTKLEEARQNVRDVIRSIQQSTRLRGATVLPTPASLALIRKGLEPREALVLYGLLNTEPVALVLTRAQERIVSLGDRHEIASEIDALLTDELPYVQPTATKALSARLIGRLGLPEGVRRVMLSPDGDLAHIPFGLLAPDHEVVLVPSATTYALLKAGRPETGGKVLAFGDPVYGTLLDDPGVVATTRGGVETLQRVPATADEARAVGDVVRLGETATETRFRRDVAGETRWRAVHLACHGLVDREEPSRSSLALTGDDDNDGLLTALDVFRLRVPTDLAVLSACETGLGRSVFGEGLFGLPRAFLQAGASSVLVSLWPVNDQATRAFMEAFYAAWNAKDVSKRVPAAAALKVAQAHVQKTKGWEHPQYWAGWVLWGRAD